ncbi:MAG: hypothetical protein Fues2KO_19980 [Fuerstiella sp.]
MDRAKAELIRAERSQRPAHLVVGRIVLEPDDDPETVRSQMVVVEDGFFVEVVKSLEQPIGFRHPAYFPLDFMIPKDSKIDSAGMIDVGEVRMTKARPDQCGRITGRVVVPEGVRAGSAKVLINIGYVRANTPFGGTEGVGRKYVRLSAQVNSDGTFSTDKLSPGSYTTFVSCANCLATARSVEISNGADTRLEEIELELPKKIELKYRVVRRDSGGFKDAEERTLTVQSGHRWKAGEARYGWDLEFLQSEGSVSFRASYAPCQIRDLGPGELGDFLNIEPGSATERVTGAAVSGHVYLLDQDHWKRHILFRIDVGDEIPPGQQPPSPMTQSRGGLKLPRVVAYYPFDTDGSDSNGTSESFQLRNTKIADGTLRLNGVYERSGGSNGYRAVAATPNLNFDAFTIVVRIRPESVEEKANPIISGGVTHRWFGLSRLEDGTVIVTLNNQQQSYKFDQFRIRNRRWADVTCAVDLKNLILAVAVDGSPPQFRRLPAGFRLNVIGKDAERSDRVWTFTNYSVGRCFHGEVDEFTVLNGVLSADDYRQVMKKLRSTSRTSEPQP